MTGEPGPSPRTLIGGVGYRWQGDASFGLVVADALAERDWPDGVGVADLGYGAHLAAQDIAAATPPWERLVLVAGTERGRVPGSLRTVHDPVPAESLERVQERMLEAGGGVIHVDHLLVIGAHFGWLPRELALVELEPVSTGPTEALSPAVRHQIDEAIAWIRRLARAPAWPKHSATAT